MGTDISIFAERLIEGEWQPWPKPRPNDYSKGKVAPVPAIEDMGRPYSLFSVMAGSGIGLRSRMGTVPGLPAKRGLPPDMNKLYRRYFRLQPGDPTEVD